MGALVALGVGATVGCILGVGATFLYDYWRLRPWLAG